MSDTYEEDRPKLKAKRFNKFESSSSRPKIVSSEDCTKQGYKRSNISKCDDDNRPCKQRKLPEKSFSYNVPSSTTKNLANNRLKKLQEQIQSELKTRNEISAPIRGKSTEIPLNQNNDSIIKPCNTNSPLRIVKETVYKKCDVAASQYLPTPEVHRNRDHSFQDSFSPPNRFYKKNLANERLQSIKKKLNTTDLSSKSTEINVRDTKVIISMPEESPNSSTIQIKEKTVSGLKRNISNITNTYDYDVIESSSKRLEVEQNVPSTLITVKKSCDIDTQRSGDTNKLHNSTENSSSKLNQESTPASQRLLRIKEANNLVEGDNNGSNFKSSVDTQPPQRLSIGQQNISNNPTSQDGRSDNFMSKMAMTASWIRNHQDTSLDTSNTDSRVGNNSANVSGNSLNNTANDILNKAKFDFETEDMEWANAEPDEEIAVTKENVEEKSNIEVRKDPEKLKDVCIVVDTNVFISGLSKIRDIINLKITGSFQPLVYIPWMVITELDFMKDSCSDARLRNNILNSVKFINSALEAKNPRVIGQTVYEVDKQKYVGPSPDDKIISCCLQVAEKYETVILLSNDINLKNKAMINNLPACSMNEVMVKVMSKLSKTTKSQKIMHKMGVMCSRVICECAKGAYGKVWMRMDMLSNAPWSLVECLKRFKKYWGSVFKEMLMKQFTKTMDELHHLLQCNKYICDDSEEFVEFMKLCVTMCIFLKDIEECRGFVEITLNEITKLG